MFTEKYFAVIFNHNEYISTIAGDDFRAVYNAAKLDARAFGYAALIGRKLDGKILAMFNADFSGPCAEVLIREWKYCSDGLNPVGYGTAPCFNHKRVL